MSKDVTRYCSYCTRCQYTKSPPNQPAPLQPVIASRPWELVAVDILKVPMSPQGNQYILVAQDYFSKWPFAQGMPDQKVDRIIRILRDQVFTLVGPPERLHSDQGRNFESQILGDLCKAFQVTKSRTTPYHPMGDGLVERMNRSLLNLLRTFIQNGETGSNIFNYYCTSIGPPSIQVQACLLMRYCLDRTHHHFTFLTFGLQQF